MRPVGSASAPVGPVV